MDGCGRQNCTRAESASHGNRNDASATRHRLETLEWSKEGRGTTDSVLGQEEMYAMPLKWLCADVVVICILSILSILSKNCSIAFIIANTSRCYVKWAASLYQR